MQIFGRNLTGEDIELSIRDGVWAPPDGSESFELGRLTCLPGLVDAHAHLSGDDLELVDADPTAIVARALAAAEAGVAICLDKGWGDDTVLEMTRSGALRRSRVVAAGTMLRSSDGYWNSFGRIVDDDSLPEVVSAMAADRDWIKLVGDWPRRGQGALPNFGEPALQAAVEAAHAAGARVAVHTMAPGVAGAAVRAGVDSIEHGLFLDEEDLAMLTGRGGVWVPTILRVEEVLANLKPGSSGAEVLGRGLDNVRRVLPLAAELGLVVMSGSDLAVAPSQIGREVAALVRFGLPVEAAIAGASVAGARAVGMALGFEVGDPADLAGYDGDPLADPLLLEHPTVVISGGVLVTDRR